MVDSQIESVYHGTTINTLPLILKNGFTVIPVQDKYQEIRSIFSKYVNPQILTDAFFDKYINFMNGGKTNVVPAVRIEQLQQAGGVFVTGDQNHAALYATQSSEYGKGEFERGIICFLEEIPKQEQFLNEQLNNPNIPIAIRNAVITKINTTLELIKILKENMKHKDKEGHIEIEKKTEDAIVVEITSDIHKTKYLGGYPMDVRLSEPMTVDEITRIGYVKLDEKGKPTTELKDVESFLREDIEKLKKGKKLSYDPQTTLSLYLQRKKKSPLKTPINRELPSR